MKKMIICSTVLLFAFSLSIGSAFGLTDIEMLGKKAYRSMVFVAIRIKRNKGRCPLDIKIRRQGLSVKRNAQRDHVFSNKSDHSIIRIRNRIHLLTANSTGVEEIKQHRLFLDTSPDQGRIHFRFPFDVFRHDYFTLSFTFEFYIF
jgi:hypothetical protein